MRTLISTLFSVLLAGLLYVAWLYVDMQNSLNKPMVIKTDPLSFEVRSGESMKSISQRLKQQGIYNHPEYLRTESRRKGFDNRIQVGEYELTTGMTPLAFLEMLVAGRVVQHSVTLVEGWTFRQFLDALHVKDDLEHTLIGLSDEQIMEQLGKPGEHPEGRFYPDSYFYTSGSSDLEILRRAYQAMEVKIAALWEQRDKDLPYKKPYDALIMASIIEKETGKEEERPVIAGVFVRRLQKGMMLQTDPTVIYGIGQAFDGNLTRKHLQADTPYNTYTRTGLPPTPIAMFGTASLHAALHPAKGDALYFVSIGDGSHHFSATLEEHNKAVAQYQLNQK